MFNWAKQQLANVAGTQEPIHGAEAFHSIAEKAKEIETPYTEISREDIEWKVMDSTCVETQTFYFMTDSGLIGMCQVIYSNVGGLRTTCQFTSKIFSTDPSKPTLWCSNQLENPEFSEDSCSFYADGCAVELSDDGNSWSIKSMTDDRCLVNLTVTRETPGYQIAKDGLSTYGTDSENPWGSMRHAFWPRCKTEGTLTTADGAIDFKGKAFYVYALQGMKPHHAAARWNFISFQGETYSANVMEFITPAAYENSKVSVGAIVKDGEIITAGPITTCEHTKTNHDEETGWDVPENFKFTWEGQTKDGKPVSASIEGQFDPLDRIDVMAEVPGFVKKIVANAAGTKPYIYQYSTHKSKLPLKLKIGDQEITEQGVPFAEASFVSE
ncbi:putative cell survival pathways protein [Ceratocystis pirilliformis]|uniref:Cell survival pathways protein n=1 Tax=Ceratocystis pirilliformis TaxID=259994 RepID=A0ABR3Z5P0_9PEZI